MAMPDEEEAKARFGHAIEFVQGYLHPVMSNGAYSFGLLTELAGLSLNSPETVLRVIEEIRFLEQGLTQSSTTKPVSMFTGHHLAGYWHKHYFAGAFIPENLRLEMHRDDTVERVWGKYVGQAITQEHVTELVRSLVLENFSSRLTASRLTGEWLIFSMDQGRRTYLTLAKHTDGDQVIAERIRRHQAVDQAAGWDWRTSRFTLGSAPA